MRNKYLDFNYLIKLEALLVERGPTRAAERLHLTQPAVSNALAELREHFGDALLVRRGRALALTPFAEGLLGPLQAALAQMRSIVVARPDIDPASSGREFGVMTCDYIALVFLTRAVRRLAALASNVTIAHVPASEPEQFDRGEADVLILPTRGNSQPSHPHCVLFSEPVAYIASTRNRCAARLTWEEFLARPRVVPSDRLVAGFEPEGLTTAPAMSLPLLAIPSCVASTEYVAAVPEGLMALFERVLPLRRVHVYGAEPVISYIMQWRRETADHSVERWFIGELRKAAAELDGDAMPDVRSRSLPGRVPRLLPRRPEIERLTSTLGAM
ncbi:MAG: LysR family transcriptional regulator [Pseudomonadota bacterium]|jgi:DNA-binding transcriptional LysR family regulator|nr:LysR family transcriptional regulator [Pseudomonadota bacterium]